MTGNPSRVLSTVLLALVASTAQAQGDEDVSVQWAGPTAILLGPEGELYAGEVITLSVEGRVCIDHTNRTEQKGFFPFNKTVRINHDNWHTPEAVPILIQVREISSSQTLGEVQVRNSASLTVSSGVDGVRTAGRVYGFVPNVGPRGNSHGAYTLRVTVNSDGRLVLLRNALTAGKLSPGQLSDTRFLDRRTRARFPTQLADLLVKHAQRFYRTDDEGRDLEVVYRLAVDLDETNVGAVQGVGEAQFRRGAYSQAEAQFNTALALARANLARSRTRDNQIAFGGAAIALAENYLKIRETGLPEDLKTAEVLFGQAAQAFHDAGDSQKEIGALWRRARVLSRIHSPDALRGAIDLLARARSASPRPLQ